MKKVTLLSSAVLAGTIALSGVTGVANASESHSHSTTHKSHSTQTHQGNRPYGGVAPKGMTNAQYAELEKSRNASQMSKKHLRKSRPRNTKIADKYKTTIYAPQKTFKPHK